jgi:hypothetical protein
MLEFPNPVVGQPIARTHQGPGFGGLTGFAACVGLLLRGRLPATT